MAHNKVSLSQVKRDISDLVNQVAYGDERIILTSHGKAKAALISKDDLERLGYLEKQEQRPLSEAESLEDLVAAIRRLPSSRKAFEPAKGSLADALAAQPDDPSFDLQAWKTEWAQVEEELTRTETRSGP